MLSRFKTSFGKKIGPRKRVLLNKKIDVIGLDKPVKDVKESLG